MEALSDSSGFISLFPVHIESRLSACKSWLQLSEKWFQRIIQTDENMFVLTQAPDRQNDRIWAPALPNIVAQCKNTFGEKCMAWTGIVDGRCLPVVWFQGSVNGEIQLELLQNIMWPSVKAPATRKQYWYQQDRAPCHVNSPCLEFLKTKFGY